MKDTIEIPVEISTKKLSLEEIGAITVLMAYPHIDDESKEYYAHNLDVIAEKLSSVGILTMNDGKLEIDLSINEPYFQVNNWDEYENPIYSRPSSFEGSDWAVKPFLFDMTILYKNCSDANIRRPWDEEIFDSLEDAEAYFREEDKKSLNYGGK
jgi:hypothetical protein